MNSKLYSGLGYICVGAVFTFHAGIPLAIIEFEYATVDDLMWV